MSTVLYNIIDNVKGAQQTSHEYKLLLLQGSLIALFLIMLIFCNTIPQRKAYHNFVDKRALCGICNFCDVISNVPFLIVGAYGIWAIGQLSESNFLSSGERFAWCLFFLGTFFVGFGSGYYHLCPNNDRLFWDRMPMCISFAGFNLALVEVLGIYEPSPFWQLTALFSCLLSCYYWRLYDDLRFYLIIQFYPMAVAIPVFLAVEPRCTHMKYIYFTYSAYLFAKLTEFYDRGVFRLTMEIISGHSVKHLAAAFGILALVPFLQYRTVIS
jgi:hypothetical protein